MQRSDRARVDNQTDELAMARNESTGKKAATAASKVLNDPKASKAAKTAAASALTQSKSKTEVTSVKAASAASKVLNNPKSSKAAKTAAASALTQKKR